MSTLLSGNIFATLGLDVKLYNRESIWENQGAIPGFENIALNGDTVKLALDSYNNPQLQIILDVNGTKQALYQEIDKSVDKGIINQTTNWKLCRMKLTRDFHGIVATDGKLYEKADFDARNAAGEMLVRDASRSEIIYKLGTTPDKIMAFPA